jgi:raffinose/stachyose/melibiose transport system permease protein
VFDIVFVMTHGGPNRASETPAVLLYFESFQYNDFGYGSSVGVFILVTGILVSIALTRVLFREEA